MSDRKVRKFLDNIQGKFPIHIKYNLSENGYSDFIVSSKPKIFDPCLCYSTISKDLSLITIRRFIPDKFRYSYDDTLDRFQLELFPTIYHGKVYHKHSIAYILNLVITGVGRIDIENIEGHKIHVELIFNGLDTGDMKNVYDIESLIHETGSGRYTKSAR